MNILLTGAAGFIGMHVAIALIARGHTVVGIDNLNDYYDVTLKQHRLREIQRRAEIQANSAPASHNPDPGYFSFKQADINEQAVINDLFAANRFHRVIHLAAQAGVRYSMENPQAYIQSNIVGFSHILEACRHHSVEHLVYASSSSVYGANESMPFATGDNVDHPLSLYGATKKANELMAHAYSHLYGLPTTGLRFFTVYGPWGRPDMSPFLFIRAILADQPIQVFNYGNHRRDFTYIDDIVEGVVRVMEKPAVGDDRWSGLKPNPASSKAPWKIYNIGNSQPVPLLDFIGAFEQALGKTAIKEFLPLQPGDVPDTYADTTELIADMGYQPKVSVNQGVKLLVDWYRDYYSV